jgi:hypothetical protein
MILCPKCQTPLFFDFDGLPQVGDSFSEPPSVEVESVQNLEDHFINEEVIGEEYQYEENIHEQKQMTKTMSEPMSEPIEVQSEFDLNSPLGNFEDSSQSNVNSFNISLQDEKMQPAGQLLYEIQIEGIDGSKLRNELYEELKDARWGWVAIELMGAIKMGCLVIKDVSAVKASLLINRLKALPLEIKWKQNS